jgi:hypothetical protein
MGVARINDRTFAPAYRTIYAALSVRAATEMVLLIPVVAAGIFVWLYAISYPLTDEWLLLRNAMIAHDMGWSDPLRTISAMTWQLYVHPLVLPNLIYLLLGPVFDYDARVFIFITLVCFATMLVVFRTEIASNAWAALPVAFVLFAPSHYMEFMWGFQFAMATSIALAVLGLAVFNRTTPEESAAKFSARLAGALCLIIAGLMSSGEAIFGFPALLVLGLFKRLSVSRRCFAIGISLPVFYTATALVGASADLRNIQVLRDIMAILTALGAVLVGSPVGLTAFPFNCTAAIGLAICVVVVITTVIAWRRGLLSELAMPVALFTFGFLVVAGIVISRPFLGNWHLQAALPAILGAYGAAIVLARHLISPIALALQALMTALVALVAIGYWYGYTKYGPDYNAYANKVSNYMHDYLDHPDAPKPYPPTGGWDFDSAMASFLRNNGPQR